MSKIREWVSFIFGAVALVFGVLFYAQKQKTESVESDLAKEKSTTEIKLNDQEREAAKSNADDLLADYERSKRSQ